MRDQENPLFTFAVITDTHLKLSEGAEKMLWSTHHLANLRSRFVLQELKRVRPDFVVHLGDIIHPVPGLPEYASTAELFHQIFGELDCPIYTTPGNHDIGDKFRAGMPAPVVSRESVGSYQGCFGVSYQAFDHNGCRFLLINSPILNSGLPLEEEQRRWLEAELVKHDGKRLFFLMHYPPYLRDPNEAEHYDNIDEPARSWLLNLMAEHHVEAVFAGHAHAFFYNRHESSDLYVVPSVTFVRQDYSELFRIGPAADYGRNDLDKLGFFLIKVYEQGHVAHWVRTAGQTLQAPESDHKQASSPRVKPFTASFGVELRHPWAEIVEIPYNYILDEFVRRKVRNDYPILAMWELGIRKMRVPISDLLDPAVRARMGALRSKGHQFTVFSFYAPQGVVLETLGRYHDLVDTLEVIVPWGDAPEAIPQLQAIKERAPIRICLSKLNVSQSFSQAIDQYIRPGFCSHEGDEIRVFAVQEDGSAVVDSLSFRIGPDADPWNEILAIAKLTGDIHRRASVTLQLASDSEAGVVDDDLFLARRVAVAAAAASAVSELDLYIDTFVDMDRGYYVRHGLVDRRYNLRRPGLVLRHLSSVLSPHSAALELGQSQLVGNGHHYWWRTRDRRFVLLVANPDVQQDGRISLPDWHGLGLSGTGRAYDLLTGRSETIHWHRDQMGVDGSILSDLIADLVLIVIEE